MMPALFEPRRRPYQGDLMSFAFQFPGQGSQSIGMLGELADSHSLVKACFEEAGEVLGYDLWQLVSDGPEDRLNQTEYTQPALLAAGIACWRVWQAESGPMPEFLVGHSLGEYSALVAADVLDFADGLRLVQRRGQLMQSAVPEGEGAMAALIGMDDAAVRDLCREQAGERVLQAVNFNAPGQVVIAGHSDAVQKAMEASKEQGCKMAKQLPVSVPSHSALMKEAAEQLGETLQAVPMREPRIAVLHNVDAQPRHHVEDIRQALIAQLYSPVLWTDCIGKLAGQGVTQVIECGPGRVLSGLLRRIDRSLGSGSLHDPAALQAALALVKED